MSSKTNYQRIIKWSYREILFNLKEQQSAAKKQGTPQGEPADPNHLFTLDQLDAFWRWLKANTLSITTKVCK